MPERDEALLRKVGDTIAAEPERYDQAEYFTQSNCGTTACVAGHTVLTHPEFEEVLWDPTQPISGRVRFAGLTRRVETLAADLLGLSTQEEMDLFDPRWEPTGDPSIPLHLRVRDALYALADGASIDEVTA